MNKILFPLLFTLLAAGVAGCTKVEPIADFDAAISDNAAAVIEAPGATELVITTESTGTLDISWRAADYGKSVPAMYTVALANGDKSIKYPVGTGLKTLSIPLQELNKRLVTELGLTGGEASNVAITVESLPLASNGNPTALNKHRLVSKPLSMTITPFFATTRPDLYYLVGDINGLEGAPVWNPSSTDYILLADDNDALTYHYIGYFKEGAEFKIFPADCIGGWDKPVLGLKDGVLQQSGDASNIALPEGSKAGYYHLTFRVNRGKLDPTKCTYSFEPFNASSKPTFSQMGIIGNAGLSWDKDVFLEQAGAEPHLWIGRDIVLKEGEFKLRADAAWSSNWGGTEQGQFPSNFGMINGGGENWKVTAEEAGTYTIYFNDLTGHYFFDKMNK